MIDVTDRRKKPCDDCQNYGERIAVLETNHVTQANQLAENTKALKELSEIMGSVRELMASQSGFQKGVLWIVGGGAAALGFLYNLWPALKSIIKQ
jgi:hypothetical protein